MDAWATVADVLSFYQERIINEGYLRTARERLSLHELSKLVGYRLKPGLSASTHLAFTVEDEPGEILIPKGTGVQTIPKQKELPQTFETMEDLKAKHAWNMIKPRKSFPLEVTYENAYEISRIHVEEDASSFKQNDVIVFEFKGEAKPVYVYRRIARAEKTATSTKVYLQPAELSRLKLSL